jgi:hypothetical protein
LPVEDATFRAWNGIVSACISAQVEFLLLTGNSFNARTNSLRARVALEQGFEQLAAHDIAVFVTPGALDPAAAWKRHVQLPPNVTLLTDADPAPVAVIREQRVLASIRVLAMPDTDDSHAEPASPAALSVHKAPFQIGVVPAGTPVRWRDGRPIPLDLPGVSPAAARRVQAGIDRQIDYIALGEGTPQSEHFAAGVAHDPGAAQALSGQGTGPRGCSLIQVAATGEPVIDARATAPVRWDDLSVTVEARASLNDLIERMALVLMEQVPDDSERLRIIRWRLSGEGGTFEKLAEPASQQQLFEKLEAELAGEDKLRRVHRLERELRRVASAESPLAVATGLAREFELLLHETLDEQFDEARRELLEQDWLRQAEARPLKEMLQQASRGRVARRAAALAAQWLE